MKNQTKIISQQVSFISLDSFMVSRKELDVQAQLTEDIEDFINMEANELIDQGNRVINKIELIQPQYWGMWYNEHHADKILAIIHYTLTC